MTIKGNTFEGGTAGVGVTTANSGGTSGDHFDTVDSGNNTGSATYNATAAIGGSGGSLGLYINSTNANAYDLWVGYQPTGSRQATTAYYFMLLADPTAWGVRISAFANASFSSNYCAIGLASGRKFSLVNNAGVAVATATNAFSLNTVYRIEHRLDNSAGGSGGLSDMYVYLGNNLVADPLLSVSATGQTFGGGNIGYSIYGKWTGTAIGSNVGGGANALQAYYDDIRVQDSSYGLLGPTSPPGSSMVWDIGVKQG